MLFDFKSFVDELREKPEKKQIVEKYEQLFGDITGGITDQKWYIDYVSKFEPINYATPEELADDFDWKLLLQIVASSFSSTYEFRMEDDMVEMYISVTADDGQVTKRVSELWAFQILRLYEIYIEEQINLQILMEENEDENEALSANRKFRIKKWEKSIVTLQTEIEINKLLGK
jgi:hypothetical protein